MNLRLLSSTFFASAVFASVSLAGCAVEPGEVDGDEGSTSEPTETTSSEGQALAVTVRFTEFQDPNANIPTSATRRVFTSKAAYRAFFGTNPPRSVNFNRDDVVFFGAGMRRTGGYDASIKSVTKSRTGLTVEIETSLVSPGPDCMVTMALTNPHVFAKFPKTGASYVRFQADQEVRSCSTPTLDCGTVLCAPGTVCEMVPVWCVRAPCPAQPQCVEAPPLSACAHVRCAAGTECIENADGTAGCQVRPGACLTDEDCTLYDNYCGGCACDVLGHNQRPVTCSNHVACFVQPCGGHTVACEAGACVKH